MSVVVGLTVFVAVVKLFTSVAVVVGKDASEVMVELVVSMVMMVGHAVSTVMVGLAVSVAVAVGVVSWRSCMYTAIATKKKWTGACVPLD